MKETKEELTMEKIAEQKRAEWRAQRKARHDAAKPYLGRFHSYQSLWHMINNREITLDDRMAAMSIAIGMGGSALGILVMLATGVNWKYTIAPILMILLTPPFTVISQKYFGMFMEVKWVIAIFTIFLVPVIWFQTGGSTAGGTLWMVFVIQYILLTFRGVPLRILMTICLIVDTVTFHLGVVWADKIVFLDTINKMYINTYGSLIILCISMGMGVFVQKHLYIFEKEFSDRKAAEAEAANRQLVKNNEELDRMNAAQKQFLAVMSHELRNPMNGVIGYNRLILEDPGASEEIKKYAAAAIGSGNTILQIINDILDYSKMDAQKLSIRPVEYNIRELSESVFQALRMYAREKNLNYQIDLNPKLPTLLVGDDLRIRQLMINLLSNAVKYTQKGDVILTVRHEDKNLSDVMLTIAISDTGCGISEEGMAHLFAPYSRLNEEAHKYIQGTGLGLSIVKNLTELMNGTIEVQSRIGEGSTFILRIPQKRVDRPFDEPAAVEKPFLLTDANILCVDDMGINRQLFTGIMKRFDCRVDTASSGEQALEMANEKKYDLIFMDNMMPGIGGIEACRRLKTTDGLNAATPVVAFTASATPLNEDPELVEAGFDDMLQKPVDMNHLNSLLHKYFAN